MFSRLLQIFCLSANSNTRSHYTNPLPPSLNNSTLDWPESASPGRYSPHNLLGDHTTTTFDISNSSDPPESSHFRIGTSTNNLSFQSSENNQHQHQQPRWRQSRTSTDNGFHTAMEPPASGYPGDLSHETSSTSEIDIFSSPRLRRFSYPLVSESTWNGDDGDNSGIDDILG
ncbi:hypothetical protein RRG08_006862 [Elysia crispata]|uniref:Uncharacterized protein n=1 Tax=Elysia crispata TaxID=231223 RepID=A0AAE1B7R1_9GAST|nr:hypothetical protein RRG08_006862 [Elysia crispata]